MRSSGSPCASMTSCAASRDSSGHVAMSAMSLPPVCVIGLLRFDPCVGHRKLLGVGRNRPETRPVGTGSGLRAGIEVRSACLNVGTVAG